MERDTYVNKERNEQKEKYRKIAVERDTYTKKERQKIERETQQESYIKGYNHKDKRRKRVVERGTYIKKERGTQTDRDRDRKILNVRKNLATKRMRQKM